jgi:hypothetical protein
MARSPSGVVNGGGDMVALTSLVAIVTDGNNTLVLVR